jgi:cytochrome c2
MKRLLPFTLLLAAACTRTETIKTPAAIGDANRGKEVIARFACQTCHIIPGVPGSGGMLGPSLEHYGSHATIAAKIQLTPENLARYIEDPLALDPQSRMPPLGLTQQEARDTAAYLLTLK